MCKLTHGANPGISLSTVKPMGTSKGKTRSSTAVLEYRTRTAGLLNLVVELAVPEYHHTKFSTKYSIRDTKFSTFKVRVFKFVW
jgi:hypothetical protein